MLHIHNLMESRKVCDALSSEVRIKILEMIKERRELNLDAFAKALGISNSAVTMHVKKLQDAGLVVIRTASGVRGSQKICSLAFDRVLIELNTEETPTNMHTAELGIGHFCNYEILPTCGIVTQSGVIGEFDEPRYFSFPERYNAAALWFGSGYVEYKLPNSLRPGEDIQELQISFEIAAEAPGFSSYYPSDIYFTVNGVSLGYWTIPGEYNDRRGNFTPAWWFPNLGQYGKLKMLIVNTKGTFIDGFLIAPVTIDKLNIKLNSEISFVLSSPPTAANPGGLTLFGKNFGDYNQGILINMLYHKPANE